MSPEATPPPAADPYAFDAPQYADLTLQPQTAGRATTPASHIFGPVSGQVRRVLVQHPTQQLRQLIEALELRCVPCPSA